MISLRTIVTSLGLLLLAGCAEDTACGCPAYGGPSLQSATTSLQFASTTSSAESISFIYGGIAGSKFGESDDCGSGSARIVTVGAMTVANAGSGSVLVTPETSGSCTLTFRYSTRTLTIPVTVL